MSSGMFNWDWYIDPPWDDISLRWLINFVQNIRVNPVLSQAISAETEQFEMVPMPKEVIQHLASVQGIGKSIGLMSESGSVQDVAFASGAVRKFSQAVEAGKLEDAMAMVSSSYRDASGRDAKKLEQDLRKITSGSRDLRITPGVPENLVQIGDYLLANVPVSWEASVAAAKGFQPHSSASRLEVIFRKGGKDAGKIVAMRVL